MTLLNSKLSKNWNLMINQIQTVLRVKENSVKLQKTSRINNIFVQNSKKCLKITRFLVNIFLSKEIYMNILLKERNKISQKVPYVNTLVHIGKLKGSKIFFWLMMLNLTLFTLNVRKDHVQMNNVHANIFTKTRKDANLR